MTTFQARDAAEAEAGGAVIRTPDQRLRVFVSSTLRELLEERKAAREAIGRLRLTPVVFEQGARPYPPRTLYRAYLEQSHVFVGIYWQQYGWIAADMEVSGIEDEYSLAEDKPRLIYIREPAPDRDARLAEMLDRIRSEGGASYKSFASPAELETLIGDDLAVLLSERFEGTQVARAVTAGDSPGVGIPAPTNRFIGRDREAHAVQELLEQPDVRLVTLTGPGGVGKSRLALEVARSLHDRFRDGVRVVLLDVVPTAGMVAAAIQQALGLRQESPSDPVDVLKEYLRDRQLLLVLDGFEHVIEAAPVVAGLLGSAPRVEVLVTSREVLRISGEHAFHVPPLSVPETARLPIAAVATSEAVRLFVDRAQSVTQDFRLDDGNAGAVAEIARRLDGLPLAIELAAARVRILPPAAILRRLETHLGLLTEGPRDLPQRQRTLRSAIDWSYDLLAEGDKALLARLGVFLGGWTLDAVEVVCADGDLDPVEALSSLVDKSLVRRAELAGAEPRFTMLEVVREYALDRLGERGELEQRRDLHAAYFLTLAERGSPERIIAPQEQWIERFNVEGGNLRTAMRWLLERGAPGRAARMGWALWNCWWLRRHLPEAVSWMEEVLAAQDSLSVEERALAALLLGVSAWGLGDHERGVARLRTAYALARDLEDRRAIAGAQSALGPVVAQSGDLAEGEDLLHRALATYRELHDPWATSYATFGLAQVLHMQDRSREALPLLEEIVGWAQEADERMMLTIGLGNLGWARLRAGDLPGAQASLLQSLQRADDLGDRGATAWALDALATLAGTAGDHGRGALLLGAAERARASIGSWLSERQTHERTEQQLRAALGDERFAVAFRDGQQLSVDDATDVAGGIRPERDPTPPTGSPTGPPSPAA